MTLAGTKPQSELTSSLPRWGAVQTRIATVGDQVIVSATNFGLTLMIGRVYAAEEFAAYGIGLSIGLMLQGIQRHAITIPLMLQPAWRVRRRVDAVLGEQFVALLLAIACGAAALLIAGVLTISRYGTLIVSSSIVMLFVYLQLEFARAFLVKIGRPWLLLVSAGWYFAVASVLSLSALHYGLSYEGLLGILAAAMLLHAAVVTAVAGFPSLKLGWLRLYCDLRRYGGWAGAATLTYTGYNHVPLLLLGGLAAPLHAAAFVAARSLLQPLQILLRGFDIADKSRFAERSADAGPRHALTLAVRIAAAYAAIGIAFGVLVAAFAGEIMTFAYGQKFAGHGAVLIAWVPVYILVSVTMPLESLVYIRNAFAGYYAVRGIASLIALAAAYPLIVWSAEVGAVIACGIGWLLAVTGTAALLIRGTRQ